MFTRLKAIFLKLAPARQLPTDFWGGVTTPSQVVINERIQENPDITPEMKLLARQLVYSYLPAITLSYTACSSVSEPKSRSIGRDIDDINQSISDNLTDCLLDIEQGAVFNDTFGDVFLANLISFEEILERQNQKNCI